MLMNPIPVLKSSLEKIGNLNLKPVLFLVYVLFLLLRHDLLLSFS